MSEPLRAAARVALVAHTRSGGTGLLDGWSRGDILALAGVIVAVIGVIIGIVPPFRRFAVRLWRAAMLRAGIPRRRYAKWFTDRWGVYENPYLDDVENLDLRNTYVPLSFSAEDIPETLTIATDVLADPGAGNLIIDGGPGSGKSTLLKAYGVAVLQNRRLNGRRSRTVPFLVQLRKLARFLVEEKTVTDYLIDEILVAGAGMPVERARHFLRYSLGRRQVIVMFDGLDEVTADHYQAVLEAVFRFKDDNSPDFPTRLARLFLTCRRQNFLGLRDDWVPAFSRRECSLAPLRNSEIFSYLDKIRAKFKTPSGPESFMQAVRASGTLDLHRIPLILAMSVGLYSRKDYFEIPSSIAELYQAMIREMLDRHSFRRDHGGAALRFQVGDKYRFLREFSLHAAASSGGFDDFGKADLVSFGEGLAPQLDAVRDPGAMVQEIIERSGLLTDVAEGGVFVFAHRSIQEFLAAEELRKRDNGDDIALDKSANPEWRQVAQFYTAGQEQRQIDQFLCRLSARDPGLAAYCLAGAKPSDQVARAVLDALEPIDNSRLPALAAATMSPRLPVQELAIDRLCAAFAVQGNALSTASTDVDGMMPMLSSLAGTNAAKIAALVPRVIADLPDDPRLVEPLWRCLAAPGIERLPECRAIVARLLTLVMEPDGFAELARQDRYDRDFVSDRRWRAYPFGSGLDRGHNLVTLLAWADYLDVMPAEPNRFFQAKAAGRLDRVEADRRRTVSFSLCWPARIVSGLELLAAFPIAVTVLSTHPGLLMNPFGWKTLLLVFVGVYLAPFGAFAGLAESIEPWLSATSRLRRYLGDTPSSFLDRPGQGNCVSLLQTSDDDARGSLLVLTLLAIVIASIPVIKASVPGYIALAVGAELLFLVTNLRAFDGGVRYYPYRPNDYVDMYEDPRTRPWLGLAGPGFQLGDEGAGAGGPAE